eukprot:1060630-Amphidinium_carterae.1
MLLVASGEKRPMLLLEGCKSGTPSTCQLLPMPFHDTYETTTTCHHKNWGKCTFAAPSLPENSILRSNAYSEVALLGLHASEAHIHLLHFLRLSFLLTQVSGRVPQIVCNSLQKGRLVALQ